jgi:acyl-CoA synthetase (AMP-forming)/AMP-acid ligase II
MCSVEYVQLFLAVTYAGAIIAPLNYRWVRNCTFPVLLSCDSEECKGCFVSLVIQSFEEAAQAVELVQPSAFVFDGAFTSWALRLMESDRFPSIGLYLLLGDPCSTSHAAADCKVLAGPGGKTLSLFGLIEQCGPYKRLCTHLVVAFTRGYFCLGILVQLNPLPTSRGA